MAKHECVINGCAKRVDIAFALCGDHFRAIPDRLRAELVRAYNRYRPIAEQSVGFFTALAAIHGWITQEMGGDEDPGPRYSWDRLVASVRARDQARLEQRVEREKTTSPPILRLVP